MREIVSIVIVGVVLAAPASSSIASIENPDLNEYYHLGRYYADTGQYRKAIGNYRSMIGKHPNTRQAEEGWLNMGNCYYHLMLEAGAELTKARARIGTTARDIQRLEANVLTYMNDAISSYQKVIAQFPKSKAEAIVRIGKTYAGSGPGKLADARLQFRKVVEGCPEEAGRAQLLLGDTYADAGDPESAKQMYTIARSGFPEVASLASLKTAAGFLNSGDFSRAADGYGEIISCLGIDGAYDSSYHPVGNIMKKAVAGEGDAEAALNNIKNEISGYRAVIDRFPGTGVCMETRLELARAYWFNDMKGDAVKVLEGMASEYPKSVWKVKALFLLAELQGASGDAVLTYGRIIRSFPESRFRVKAQMELAETYLGLAGKESDPVEKNRLKGKAREACNAVRSSYPFSPEADEAKVFLEKNGL